jgi:transcription elongation GreA/GreB family factor
MKRNVSRFPAGSSRRSARGLSAHPPPVEERSGRSASHEQGGVAVADESPPGAVALDATVAVRNLDTNEIDVYTLVHPENADVLSNRISSFAPLGKAIYGRRAGEIVTVEAPGGVVRFRIESVRFPSGGR